MFTSQALYSLEDKQNPNTRKEFETKLTQYLEIAKNNPKKLQVWFWDESGFSLRVLKRKIWGKKGNRKKIALKRSRGRVNVMGGLRVQGTYLKLPGRIFRFSATY